MNPYPQITQSQLVPYGTIRRSHGHRGDVVIEVYSEELFEIDPEFLFLKKEGLYIPFGVLEMRGRKEQLITSLEEITSEEVAKIYTGVKVYIHEQELPTEQVDEIRSSSQSLRGAKVVHPTGKEIGVVEDIEDSTANLLLIITTPSGEELLLPYVEEWIVEYDHWAQRLTINCPIELTEPL